MHPMFHQIQEKQRPLALQRKLKANGALRRQFIPLTRGFSPSRTLLWTRRRPFSVYSRTSHNPYPFGGPPNVWVIGGYGLRKSSKNRHRKIAKLCSNILVLNVSTIKDDYYCRSTVNMSFIVQDSSLRRNLVKDPNTASALRATGSFRSETY